MRRLSLLATVAVLFLVGCDHSETDRYPESLRYTLRTDAIVVRTPAATPLAPTPAGTGDAHIAAFATLGGEILDPLTLPKPERERIEEFLTESFGTPANPKLIGSSESEAAQLAEGSRLYRRHCTQCHGTNGDGRGPAGAWHYPYPRDFRSGIYKSAYRYGNGIPPVEHLARVLRSGVSGTAMQAFDLLPEKEIVALSEYVRFLTVRGMAEAELLRSRLDVEGDPLPLNSEAIISRQNRWLQVPTAKTEEVILSEESISDEQLRRGDELFRGAGGCASCHADYGRTPSYRYDVWGAVNRVPDLTRGEWRWGKSVADHAAKIRHGLPGAGMPASSLSPAQIADLAAFVSRLPTPARLPSDLRSRIDP